MKPLPRPGEPIEATGLVVLVVQEDVAARGDLGKWFEEAGFVVLFCPGPSPPMYSCMGADTGACPLVEAADLVVLDLALASDAALEGTSSLELLMFYIATGKPIIVLSRGSNLTHMFVEERLVALRWPPDRKRVLAAAESILREEPAGRP